MENGGLVSLNSDEFETVFELVLSVFFMAFGVFAMCMMCRFMADNVECTTRKDKLEVTQYTEEKDNPFFFTGYQAYMMAWHMDEYSYEDLCYVSKANGIYLDNATDVNAGKVCTLSVFDNNGKLRPNFETWRNQKITGQGVGTNSSVSGVLSNTVSASQLEKLYLGSGSVPKFKLILTDEFSLNNDLGNSPNSGGKTFKWVLAPCP